MKKLYGKPIYIINNTENTIKFLDDYIRNDRMKRELELGIKHECLYFVPTPCLTTDEKNERKYRLVLSYRDGYVPFHRQIFLEKIIKELEEKQAIRQTQEFGEFFAYKVINKESFIEKYIAKDNTIKIKKDSHIYLLKLNTSNYSIVIKNDVYQKLPFINIKMSSIDKLLEDKTIQQVYYNYNLKKKTVNLEKDKNITIRLSIGTKLIKRKKENLWEACRILSGNKRISTFGRNETEAIIRLEKKYQDYIDSQEQKILKEEVDVNLDKDELEIEE